MTEARITTYTRLAFNAWDMGGERLNTPNALTLHAAIYPGQASWSIRRAFKADLNTLELLHKPTRDAVARALDAYPFDENLSGVQHGFLTLSIEMEYAR